MRRASRLLRASIALLGVFLSAGCWSSREIETQSVYIGMAMDKSNTDETEAALDRKGGSYPKRDAIASTIQIVAVQTATGVSPKQAGGEKKQSFRNLTLTGDSVLEILREASLRLDRPLIGHHLKVVVIGERLAREASMGQLLDFFLTDNDIRMSSLVFVSNGQASEVMESGVKEEVPSFHLWGLAKNRYRSLKILPSRTLATVNGFVQAGDNFLLQNVIAAKGEMKLAGAGVFDGRSGKLRGFLNEEEVQFWVWLTGRGQGGVLKIYDEQTRQVLAYEIEMMSSRTKAAVSKDGHVYFDVRVESRGRLTENWTSSIRQSDPASLKKAEKMFEEAVSDGIGSLLRKLQQDYGIDAAGFGNELRIQHPKTWNKVKKNWNDRFRQASIRCRVQMTIADSGAKAAPAPDAP